MELLSTVIIITDSRRVARMSIIRDYDQPEKLGLVLDINLRLQLTHPHHNKIIKRSVAMDLKTTDQSGVYK